MCVRMGVRMGVCTNGCVDFYVRRDGVRYVRTNACTNTPIRTPNHVEHGLHIQDRDHTIQFRVLGFRLPAMSSMACSFRTVTTPSVNTATLGLPCAAQQQQACKLQNAPLPHHCHITATSLPHHCRITAAPAFADYTLAV